MTKSLLPLGVAIVGISLAVGLSGCSSLSEPPPPPPAPVAAAPPPPPPPPTKKKIVLRGVNFDANRSSLRADAVPVLDEDVRVLQLEQGVSIIVTGYADAREPHPARLSARRAETVRDYLVANGIATARIRVASFGASDPVASNATLEGRAENRRVELLAR